MCEHGDVWLGAFYDGAFMFNPSFQHLKQPHSNLTQKGGMSVNCAWYTLENRIKRRQQTFGIIQSGLIIAEKFVTDVFPPEKIKEAFEKAMNSNGSIKVLVEL